ncbi:hypothetical protein H0H87_006863 [Tephrocybe sp. NHM501043]|nr:hypothetical protein H0H87_006863 [Tephrocybe sp. NHM501043]
MAENSTPSTPVTSNSPPLPRTPSPNPPLAKPGSTPIVNIRSQSAPLNSLPKRVVGPVSGADFNELLPKVKGEDSPCKEIEGLTAQLKELKPEPKMYEHLVDAFNASCSKLLFEDVHNSPTTFHDIEIKPDINVYDRKTERLVANLEVKIQESCDPFDLGDQVPGRLQPGTEAKRTLGQITSYATAHQGSFFQTHVFSALIFPTYLRFMRWDRSGVVYTKKLPFSGPDIAIFFRRLSAASPAQRGCDTTAVPFECSAKQSRDIRRELGRLRSKALLLKISIDNEDYVISEDQEHGSVSPIGRSTRCLKAYRLETRAVVLLKDTWRVVSPSLKPEHEIYAKLNERNVTHIPEVYQGADVGSDTDLHHLTQTAVWAAKLNLNISLRTLRHYRIVLEYLEYKLEEFETTAQLVGALRDASLAHSKAVTDAKVLHRDISVGNIMMKRVDGVLRGYLIDWDLSLDMSLPDTVAAQDERTGTWQFIAVRLLERPKAGEEPLIQNQVDDVESFFHLAMWMALRYTSHGLPNIDLRTVLDDNFDAAYRDPDTERAYITRTRRLNMITGDLIQTANFSNPGMYSVLNALQGILCERYSFYKEPALGIPAKRTAWELAVQGKAEALKILEDPLWLPNLLDAQLDNKSISWETNAKRQINPLITPAKFSAAAIAVSSQTSSSKRKSENQQSGNSRLPKASRTSGQSTPHDNPSSER